MEQEGRSTIEEQRGFWRARVVSATGESPETGGSSDGYSMQALVEILEGDQSCCARVVLAMDYGQGTEGSSDGYRPKVSMDISAEGLLCRGEIWRPCVFVGKKDVDLC